MNKKIDRYILFRLFTITVFVLFVLIFIYVIIHFSDNSEDFTDKGATFAQIFGIYYLNYIPEMIRQITPLAVFIACLYLTGQLADRLEIIALKAAGVSLYRLVVPYILFALLAMSVISFLDGFIIPGANSKRIEFSNRYLNTSKKIDRTQVFRQESPNTIVKINYFDDKDSTAHRVELFQFKGDSLHRQMLIQRMKWIDSTGLWKLTDVNQKMYTAGGYTHTHFVSRDTALSLRPQDLARTTSDIYQLTYPEAFDYIASIERSGAGGVNRPKVHLYGRLAYPLSILVITLVGFSIAAVRRRGGRGFHIAAGLTISFLYIALMKVIEPFGAEGLLTPLISVLLPHLFFLMIGITLLVVARK